MKAFKLALKETTPDFQPEDQPTPKWIIGKINANAVARNSEEGPRNYLGASIIGDHCTRELWYRFRHAAQEEFEGEMIRLFERGHREEEVMAEHLRGIGLEIQLVDPNTGKQFRTSDIGGHFGGGRDGRARWGPKHRWFLVEMKTYNSARFNVLIKKKVKASSPKYYGQMQIYLNAEELPYCLFVAVCKDDDRLYIEWVPLDATDATALLERAEVVIGSQEPPDRVTDDKTNYQCKWCCFYKICHSGAPAEKNCRSCKNAEPVEDGQWRCNAGKEFGTLCDSWEDVTK